MPAGLAIEAWGAAFGAVDEAGLLASETAGAEAGLFNDILEAEGLFMGEFVSAAGFFRSLISTLLMGKFSGKSNSVGLETWDNEGTLGRPHSS